MRSYINPVSGLGISILIFVCGTVPVSSQTMETMMLMRIEDTGGIVDGNVDVGGYENWHWVWQFDHQFALLDHGSDPPLSGPLLHGVYNIRKLINGATPILAQYLSSSSVLPMVEIAVFFPDGTGSAVERFRISLEDAVIIKQDIVETIHTDDTEYDDLSFYSSTVDWDDVSLGPILPLSLVSFDAITDGNDVHVKWMTASEQGLTHFELEHLLRNSYVTVASVQAAGFSAEEQQYEILLSDMLPGTHQFRLKSVTFSGDTDYSHPVEVTLHYDGQRMQLTEPHPNPVSGILTFSLSVEVDQEVHVALYDVLGRSIRSLHEGLMPSGQQHHFVIDTAGLSQAVYLLRIAGQRIDEVRAVRIVH